MNSVNLHGFDPVILCNFHELNNTDNFNEHYSERIQRGLLNVQNSCYSNAVLQGLLGCKPFWNYAFKLTNISQIAQDLVPLKVLAPVHYELVQFINQMKKSKSHLSSSSKDNRLSTNANSTQNLMENENNTQTQSSLSFEQKDVVDKSISMNSNDSTINANANEHHVMNGSVSSNLVDSATAHTSPSAENLTADPSSSSNNNHNSLNGTASPVVLGKAALKKQKKRLAAAAAAETARLEEEKRISAELRVKQEAEEEEKKRKEAAEREETNSLHSADGSNDGIINHGAVSKSQRRRNRQRAKAGQDLSTQLALNLSLSSSSVINPTLFSPSGPFAPDFSVLLSTFQSSHIGRQEDAQEFFLYLCDKLHEEFKNMDHLYTQLFGEDKKQNSVSYNEDEWTEIGQKNKKLITVNNSYNPAYEASPISKLFMFRLRSCLSVASRSVDSLSFQPMFSLPIDIDIDSESNTSKVTDLYDAMDYYMSSSVVEGYKGKNAKVSHTSSHGTNYVKAKQTHSIDASNLPEIFTFHIKRFSFDAISQGKKLQKHIKFYPKLKFKSQYLSGVTVESHHNTNSAAIVYRLSAVVVHHGNSLKNGHYVSYVRVNNTLQDGKQPPNNITNQKSSVSSVQKSAKPVIHENLDLDSESNSKATKPAEIEHWLYIDDGHISPVNSSVVYGQLAYLLFYTRES